MKRRLTRLVVFLLLGAIVNVAVAWGCALTTTVSFPLAKQGEISGLVETPSPASPWWCQISPGRTTTLVVWEPLLKKPTQVRGMFGGDVGNMRDAYLEAHKQLMATHPWTYVGRLTSYRNLAPLGDHPALAWAVPPSRSMLRINDVEVDSIHGYPLQCLQFSTRHTLPASILTARGRSDIDLGRSVPRRLHVGAATTNSVAYAFTTWLLLFGFSDIRRFIRRKRGLCINCGYDLRGDFSAGCPECGWRREDVP